MRPGWQRRLLAELRREHLPGAAAPEVERLEVLFDTIVAAAAREFTPASQVSALLEVRVAAPAPIPAGPVGPRYQRLVQLGEGGMGEVWRARDTMLDRTVAQKLLHPHLGVAADQFLAEARLTARLQHPGVVPVYDAGQEDDGRLYYTMREVDGRTLRQWSAENLLLRPRVDLWARACAAVAYAHRAGVVHGDLSPSNVLVGTFGDALVVDWGLARPVGDTAAAIRGGTPGFAAPEAGDRHLPAHPRLDVHALGAILARLLGPAGEAAEADGPLRDLARRCLAPHPGDRPPDAAALLTVVEPWLAGALDREQADVLVEEARSLLPGISSLREDAEQARVEAAALLDALPSWAPVEEKARAWSRQESAADALQRALLAEVRFEEALRAALRRTPALPAARQLLADHYQHQHALAEREGDPRTPALEVLLRAHDDGRHAPWLLGEGRVTLHTERPARVELYRFVDRDRRLEPELVGDLGPTPLDGLALERGSYLAILRSPGCAEVRYPFRVDRGGHWDGIPPGGTDPQPIPLPRALGPDEVYVPPGWFRAGDPHARFGMAVRDLWVPGFVLRRDPTTHAELLAFLNDLVDHGELERAGRMEPRTRSLRADLPGVPVYHRDADGRYFLGPDPDGDLPDPAWPVVFVDGYTARAWCAWHAARTGQAWRLPWELEREKAARGVDGRLFPWGDYPEPTWARNGMSRPGRALPGRVDETASDVGPYGARGMAGNVRDPCLDKFRAGGPRVSSPGVWVAEPATGGDGAVHRGGAWSASIDYGRAGARLYAPLEFRNALVGFRACRAWPEPEP